MLPRYHPTPSLSLENFRVTQPRQSDVNSMRVVLRSLMSSSRANPLSLLKDKGLLRTEGFIAGQWVRGGEETFGVDDPATGDEIARVSLLGPTEARAAVEAAEKALPAWRSRAPKERGALMRRWFDLITEHTGEHRSFLSVVVPTDECLRQTIWRGS
jgi:delta 1-pyrroline-5-carboxylate dehydrogenase